MEEFETVRQDRTGFKRYFFDDSFDLYVLYDCQGGMITGFQLVYDKKATPRAITWIKDKGFRHNKVNGLDSSYHNLTPLLVRDGVFDIQAISDSFREHSKRIDEEISSLVYSTLKHYDPRFDDQFI